jgi:predicted permease
VVHAGRSLRRAPAFSASVILTLTIGIGSAAAIFAVVNAVLFRPLPYKDANRLVGVWFDMPAISLSHAQQTAATYFTFKRFAHSIEGIAVYQTGSINVVDPNGRDEPARINAAFTTANAIPLLGAAPLVGRMYDSVEDLPKAPPVAVISERLWESRFGRDPKVTSKTLVVAGKTTNIVGVMPASFRFPEATTDVWMPLQLDPNRSFSGGFNYESFARLRPGVTVAAAQRDFTNVLPRVVEVASNMAPGVTMQMVLDQAKPVPLLVPMRDDVVGDASRTLWMVAATALLVLIVTCANVANLLLVRADARHRELAVRAALGAGRVRVLWHFLTESALLAALSAAAGLGVAVLGIRLLVHDGPAQLPRLAEVRVDGATIAFTFAVAIIVAVVCSAIPAIRFLRGDPLSGLRDGGRGGTVGGRRQRTRGVLVAAQVALALVVLAASGLLLRSFQHLHAVKPGFDANGVATLWVALPSQRYPTDTSVVRFSARLAEQMAHVPGVQSVGLTSKLPLEQDGMNVNPMWVEGDATSSKHIPPLEIFATVDSGYFNAMRIPLIAGRRFDQIERQHSDEAIINQEVARVLFHDSTGRSALNKRFQELPNTPWHTVVGVVGDVRDTALAAGPTRMAYFPQVVSGDTLNDQLAHTFAIVARTSGGAGDVASVTRAMQGVVRGLDPTLPTFAARSMSEAVDASTAQLSFTIAILGVAAAVTLLLGMIGLYGVIAYVVALRTRELGLRIALGAAPSAVAAMVTRQGLTLVAGGVVAGLVLVAVSARFLRTFLFEIGPADPTTLAAATLVLVAFALLACWVPARRAARVNPTEALRAD